MDALLRDIGLWHTWCASTDGSGGAAVGSTLTHPTSPDLNFPGLGVPCVSAIDDNAR